MNSERPLLPALRWCLSCAGILLCWALWLVLGASLAALAYIAVQREVPVPDFLLRRIENELASAQLSVTFGRATLDPTGHILLQDARVRFAQFDDPLLTSRLLFLHLDFWSLLAGRTLPDEICLEEAALQIPAVISPSGTAEPLLRDLTVALSRNNKRWQVDQFAGRIGRLCVTATGCFVPPPHVPGSTPPTMEWLVGRYLAHGRRLLPRLQELEAFDDPVLTLAFDYQHGAGTIAGLRFASTAVRRPFGSSLIIEDLSAVAAICLDLGQVKPLHLQVSARQCEYDGGYRAKQLLASVAARIDVTSLRLSADRVIATAESITAFGEEFSHPVVQAVTDHLPEELFFTAAARAGGQVLTAQASANLAQKSGHLLVTGRLTPALFTDVTRRHGPRFTEELSLVDPVLVRAEAAFASGWQLTRVGVDLDAQHVTVHGVPLDAARGHVDFDGRTLLARDSLLVMGENYATGSYWMDVHSMDYRMLLTGRLRPTHINPWFRGWWLPFWRNFDFPEAPPSADVDVTGCWVHPEQTKYFGSTETPSISVRGADFESVDIVLFVRPRYTHAIELAARRANGRQHLTGWFKHTTDAVTKSLAHAQFDLTANLDLPLYEKLLGEATAPFLAPWRFVQAPQVHVAGRIDGRANGLRPDLAFSAEADHPFQYYEFPLEALTVSGRAAGDELRLDSYAAGFAGGTMAGKALIKGYGTTGELSFDANLKGADLARAIRGVESFAATDGTTAKSVIESKFIKKGSGGKLELTLSAQGRRGTLASFKGNGTANISGAELGEVHFFGLLSQLLSGLGLGFTSARFDNAQAVFQLDTGRLHFSNLRVTGRNAALDAKGDYRLDAKTLDFTARLSPFEKSHALIPKVIDLVTTPLSTFLELKLTGPITKPTWAFVLGPTNLLRNLAGSEEPTDSAQKPAAALPTTTPPASSATVPQPTAPTLPK
ncbi:MAG: AsmA-like C-terminal region-containing protein [Opitutaceae bacterium]|nr:AsmA-like C-terminal region-containing protein [Opitutaceae bacterium]